MSDESPENVLLMTATITPPPGARQLARTDPESRLADYARALAFYASPGSGIDAVVFCENSASDVSRLRGLVRELGAEDRVEFIVFDGLDYPPEYGRAYGELRLVRHAMTRSERIAAAGPDAVTWKVTGRYLVRNLARVVRTRPPRADLYFNARRWPRPWVDLYLLAWTRSGYERAIEDLLDVVREDEDLVSAEVKVWDRLVATAPDGVRSCPRFGVEPRIEGVRGLDNRPYHSGADRAKFWARNAARWVAPWLWI